MRQRPNPEQLAELRHQALLREIAAIERAAQKAIRIYQAQERADARGEPVADFWIKEAEALVAAWRT